MSRTLRDAERAGICAGLTLLGGSAKFMERWAIKGEEANRSKLLVIIAAGRLPTLTLSSVVVRFN